MIVILVNFCFLNYAFNVCFIDGQLISLERGLQIV